MQDDEDDTLVRQTPEFHEYVERMLGPMRPGLAYVRTDEYIFNGFEKDMLEIGDHAEEHFEEGPILNRGRADLKQWIDTLETMVIEHVHTFCIDFIRNPDARDRENASWGVTNLEELETVIASFADQIIRTWRDEHLASYRATLDTDPTLTEPQRNALAHYMMQYIASAAANLPNHIEDWGQERLYYDSATTEEGDLDED
jgi:uncharacterized protein YqfB (UPF0267 family)